VGHKVKNFFPAAEIRRFRVPTMKSHVTASYCVTSCLWGMVPVTVVTRQWQLLLSHLLPVVHCQFTVAYLHGAL